MDRVLRPNGLMETTREVVNMIRKQKLEFDSIAFTGMSGALVAPTVALRLKKNPVIVRKQCDGSHSGRMIEGGTEIGNYIIIDDFQLTGATLKRIFEALNSVGLPPDMCKGIFLYTGSTSTFSISINDKTFEIPITGRYTWKQKDSD